MRRLCGGFWLLWALVLPRVAVAQAAEPATDSGDTAWMLIASARTRSAKASTPTSTGKPATVDGATHPIAPAR
ncbi:MAG: hypothetical protein HYZ28_05865 [Myxococcales bacterium]|nr:hypothetical protein [Myxococcales bacterium]